ATAGAAANVANSLSCFHKIKRGATSWGTVTAASPEPFAGSGEQSCSESWGVRWSSAARARDRQLFLLAHNLPKVAAAWSVESGFKVINYDAQRIYNIMFLQMMMICG